MSDEVLIESVRTYTFLYNPNDRFYYDAIRKENAWEEISTNTGISVSDCKKRWSLLRDAYRKALKNRTTKSGQANVLAKKWKFEDIMSFMVPIFTERNQKSNLAGEKLQNVYVDTSSDTENIDSASAENSLLSPTSVSSTRPVSPTSEPPSPVSSQTLTKKQQKQAPPPAVSQVLQEYLGERKRFKREKNADHLKKFFETMEETVRTFPPSLQIEVKSKIYQLVSEYEYKNLSINENRPQQWQRTESNQQLQPTVFHNTALPCQTGSTTNTLQSVSYPHESITLWQLPGDESANPGTSHQQSEEQNITRSYDCYLPRNPL